jgi:flagellar FliL protein
MFKNKILNIAIIILVCVTLLVGAAVVVWMFVINNDGQASPADQAKQLAQQTAARQLSAKEIVSLTSLLDNVTTNLADQKHIISISFAFQLENKKAYDEFEMLKATRVQAIVLKILHSTEPDSLFEPGGFDRLSAQLMNEINPILLEGEITQIDITNFVIDRL